MAEGFYTGHEAIDAYEVPMPVEGECNDVHGFYRCNRIAGHPGQHVYRQPYASWPNDAAGIASQAGDVS